MNSLTYDDKNIILSVIDNLHSDIEKNNNESDRKRKLIEKLSTVYLKLLIRDD